jgi:beta-glucosidase
MDKSFLVLLVKNRCVVVFKKELLAFSLLASFVCPALAQPWLDRSRDAFSRADLVLQAMREDEKLLLVRSYFGTDFPSHQYRRPSDSRPGSAGYVPGIPRLGIPPQWETDGGIGVATQPNAGVTRERTALPSGLATAATWNPGLAYAAGAMIGAEARDSGFNVMLAGGVNLARDPRNGRNFEYAGEDPLLAGAIVGAEIAGIQSNHIIATVKHFALNDQEGGREHLDAQIAEPGFRESDLLAFEIAIERGRPGAAMCAYNKVNGVYACENDGLLNRVLKQDWHYPFFVMSDWGAVHSLQSAAAGLDQDSAADAFDPQPMFGAALQQAIASGAVPRARLDDMVRRILRALFDKGVVDDPVRTASIDFAAHAAVSQADAEEAIIVLRNSRDSLPLQRTKMRVAIIGGHADVGVLSGGGSSQVYPVGGSAVPGLGPASFPGPEVIDPSSPLQAIRARLPGSEVVYAGAEQAAAAAARADVAIVFAGQWAAESRDVSLTLPDQQDALIARVSAVNPRTIVVLETGGPVLMPWLDQTAAVVEAWYPGTRGGEAIARVLFGEVDASGRLPISFPRATTQLPRPHLDGNPATPDVPFTVTYSEGAAVGYKWFDRTGQDPLFPFGFGLGYGHASYANLVARNSNDTITVDFDVHNDGVRATRDVAQVYAVPGMTGWEVPKRLVGWSKLSLAPGDTQHVSLPVDPRLLATWDQAHHGWVIAGGRYSFQLGASSRSLTAKADIAIPLRRLPEP